MSPINVLCVLKHDELGVLNPSDLPISPAYTFTDGHGRPHIRANWGQLTPLEKWMKN